MHCPQTPYTVKCASSTQGKEISVLICTLFSVPGQRSSLHKGPEHLDNSPASHLSLMVLDVNISNNNKNQSPSLHQNDKLKKISMFWKTNGIKIRKGREMKSKSSDNHCCPLKLSQSVYFLFYKIKTKSS